MIKNSLVSKMIAAFTFIVAIMFILVATILSFWFENYYFEQRKNQLDMQGDRIATSAVNSLGDKSTLSVTKLENEMSFIGDLLNSDILIADSLGYVYAVSNIKYKDIVANSLDLKEMDELRFGKTIEKKGTYENIVDKPSYIYMKPIFSGDSFRGVILMYTPIEQIKAPIKKVYSIIWLGAIFSVITTSIIIYYFSQKIIIKPLSKINSVARKISKGEVEKRVIIDSNDEIGELAESFNTMADSLEKVEKNRRDFMSNVSHELRSPITSIKGFIGGILDGVIPKDKENHYLQIAYDEVQRLTRLVNDLLDLAAMESGKFSLRVTEIDINEIIKLCIIKFEPKINDKKLKVDVLLQDEHLYVEGDRDRLIQVLTNLIDNSIKYVPDGGNIKLSTKIKGDKLLVSVFNDGPNIEENELRRIWDRFYKSDKARTSKISTGLGLPIARNILSQLGEDIWVENKAKDQGVTFIFTLTRV